MRQRTINEFVNQQRDNFAVSPQPILEQDDTDHLKNFELDLVESNMQSRRQFPLQQIQENEISSEASQKIERKSEGFGNSIWKRAALRIVYHVSKFIMSLQQSTESMKFKLLSRKVFGILNDRTSDYDFYVLKKMIKGRVSLWSRLKQRLSAMFNGVMFTYVIQPDSYQKMIWDTFVLFIIVINIFYIPMKLAFSLEETYNTITDFFLNDIPSWVFLAEILINFNTAYYFEGKINSNRKAIIVNYIKGDFIIDFIVIVPFFISRFKIPFVDFVLLLRVTRQIFKKIKYLKIRVKSLFENIEEVLNLRERFATVIDLIKLIYFIIFVIHFSGCAWFYMAQYEPKGTSWLAVHKIENATDQTKYIYSIYWSTITLLTVGYGDIAPVTDAEKVFVIIMAMITCGVFGYAINSIGGIIQEMEEKKKKIRTQMAIVNSYMRKHKLTKQIQLKVRKYFEYYFKRQDEQDAYVQQLMLELPMDLQTEMMIEIYKTILMQSKFIGENFSDQCINRLCLKVKQLNLPPDETLFKKNQLIQRLHIIMSGKVKISFETKQLQQQNGRNQLGQMNSTVIRTFQNGYVIGEKAFIMNRNADYLAQTLTFCQIAYLDYDDYIETLKEFPIDYENFCLTKDNMHYNPFFKKVSNVCEICQSNHQFNKCPFTFYQANKHKILQRVNQSKPNQRMTYSRSQDKRKASLAICLNEKILLEEDLDDNYLLQLGFDDEPHPSLLSFEEHFDQFFDKFSSAAVNSQMISSVNNNPMSVVQNSTKSKKVTVFQESKPPQSPDRNESQPHKEPSNLQFRFEDGSGFEKSDDRNKKGILKKTSFLPNSKFEDMERQNSQSSQDSERQKEDIYKIIKSKPQSVRLQSQHVKINRDNRRHKFISFRYDKANQFLSHLKRLQTMESQKSFETQKSKKILEKQLTSQTVQAHHQQPQNSVVHEEDQRLDFDIDRGKLFDIYFPTYNMESVLKNIEMHKKSEQGMVKFTTKVQNLPKRSLVNKHLQESFYIQNRKKDNEE